MSNEKIVLVSAIIATIAGLAALIKPLVMVFRSLSMNSRIHILIDGDKTKELKIEARSLDEKEITEIVKLLQEAEDGKKETSK